MTYSTCFNSTRLPSKYFRKVSGVVTKMLKPGLLFPYIFPISSAVSLEQHWKVIGKSPASDVSTSKI